MQKLSSETKYGEGESVTNCAGNTVSTSRLKGDSQMAQTLASLLSEVTKKKGVHGDTAATAGSKGSKLNSQPGRLP